jgi:hypothetical protein
MITLRSGTPLPYLVGDTLRSAGGIVGKPINLGNIALSLTAADRRFLDFVGRHPFLDPYQLSQMCEVEIRQTRSRLQRLIADGLVRCVASGEVATSDTTSELVELTRAGLAVVAAQQGISLSSVVRFNGLAGGGPERPFGPRIALIRNLAHTRGVDTFFVELARKLESVGDDFKLIEWRGAATCARRTLRPDGYGIMRCRDQLAGFFLEYDRGTMRISGYLKKLAAYYDCLASGRYDQDYDGFPTILVVTVNNAAEERIVQAARAARVGRMYSLPLLLTCLWRIHDERNSFGALGQIWRRPEADFSCRQMLYFSLT